jgi:hypothetical protein
MIAKRLIISISNLLRSLNTPLHIPSFRFNIAGNNQIKQNK